MVYSRSTRTWGSIYSAFATNNLQHGTSATEIIRRNIARAPRASATDPVPTADVSSTYHPNNGVPDPSHPPFDGDYQAPGPNHSSLFLHAAATTAAPLTRLFSRRAGCLRMPSRTSIDHDSTRHPRSPGHTPPRNRGKNKKPTRVHCLLPQQPRPRAYQPHRRGMHAVLSLSQVTPKSASHGNASHRYSSSVTPQLEEPEQPSGAGNRLRLREAPMDASKTRDAGVPYRPRRLST